jgi:hypothetical protein
MIDRHTLAWLGIVGVLLDLLGGLYLAYDLLGGRRGPLRALARAATYGIVFGACYTAGLFLPFGPVAGIGLGLLLGLEYGLRPGEHRVSLLFAVLRGGVFGVAGTLLHGPRFGLALGMGGAIGLVAVYHLLRFSVARDYSLEDVRRFRVEVATAQAVRAGVVAVAAALAGLVAGVGVVPAIAFAARLLVVSWATGTLVGSATPSVERWADRLPARQLGMVGALLIFLGLVIESVQFWVVIFDVAVR